MQKNRSRKDSNVLGVSVKNYGECSWCCDKDNIETLNVPWSIWSEWLLLSSQMGNNEWGAVFWVKDKTITHYKIPKQEVSPVEVEFKEELGGCGIVHSHHNMDAFHSSQDDAYARNLYDYSIVLSNKTPYVATKKVSLPCGGFGYIELTIILSDKPQLDLALINKKKHSALTEEWPEKEMQQKLMYEELPPENCFEYGDFEESYIEQEYT